jgi:hypothetical protein
MATLSGTIEADVPLAFADREWNEFVRRSLSGSYPAGSGDLASSVADIDPDDGVVKFEKKDRQVRVTLEMDFTPHGKSGLQPDEAQRRLDQGMEEYRRFVLRRCEEMHCRAA